VAFKSVEPGLKVPPAVVLHAPPVAPPPTEPPNEAEVPPWHIAVIALPTFTVGLGLTTIGLLALTVPHDPPEVVNVSVTGVPELAAAV
jgi:hypothetical protein